MPHEFDHRLLLDRKPVEIITHITVDLQLYQTRRSIGQPMTVDALILHLIDPRDAPLIERQLNDLIRCIMDRSDHWDSRPDEASS
ncbi:hypothetical protein D3C77_742370 [compost metagenome]